MRYPALIVACLASAAQAVPPPTGPIDRLTGLTRFVDEARMKATVETLVGFGTRHTLSSQTDPRRGIGAALDYAEGEFRKAGLETFRTCDTMAGDRLPAPTRICNVVAVQRGTERPNDVVVITGHIDSRNGDPMDSTRDAPGANDDGSGTAAAIEAARVLSKFRFPGTIVYAALSGEEQGLYGGKILADHARAQGWNVIANLNNDIIGNSCGNDEVCDAGHVRVFSEGPRWQGRDDLADDIRRFGGENDSPSRNLSRFLDGLAGQIAEIGIDVRPIWRNDRFGRGGDHTEFLNAGFPAVRLTVAVEDYTKQHQDVRSGFGDTVESMDFAYLRKVTRLNVAGLAAIASAPPPPEARVEGAVSTDTKLAWAPVPGAVGYVIRWRPTDSADWSQSLSVDAATQAKTLPGVRVDDWVFGVSSIGAGGYESPVASAVPGGAFKPYVKANDGKK